MKINFFLPALLLSLVPSLSAAAFENLAAISLSPADLPVQKAAAPAPSREWTVMYFVDGKNNLESSALMDVNQMELAGSTDKVSIVVQMGRMNGQSDGDDHSEGDWTGVRRYLITRDADTEHINSPVLEDLGKADMGSWKTLTNFVTWAKSRYPARRYALVMWDHGNGWKPLDPVNAPDFYNTNKGFSLDEETGHEISLPQLASALKASGGVNFLMLDGCNMQMASVGYELRNYAEAMTASEESEPGVTVRYAQFLGKLNARPSMGAEEFAVNTVRTFRDYFLLPDSDTEGMKVTQSAVRLSKMSALREKLDSWAAAAMKAEPEALRGAKKNAKIFGEDPEFKDLYNFVELVGAGTAQPELKARSNDVLRFIRSELVIENWAQDAVSHGLSIYVPDAYDPLYDGLAWAKDGVWDDFARFMAKNFGEPAAAKAAAR